MKHTNVQCTYLKEVGSFGAHALVQVSLATLDVVVQVGPELVDQVNRVLPVGWLGVAGEQHKRHKPGQKQC